MAVDVGQFVQGTVVRLLNYGVLVKLDDGSTGLVHISEIDNNYVRDVNDYFAINDPVTVKVLAAGERGKIELSVKQAMGKTAEVRPRPVVTEGETNGSGPSEGRGSGEMQAARRESRASFEEKMNDFMRSSGERLTDLKRNIENKRGGPKKR
jgi:S1 RNA binding domain protein